MKSSLHVTQRDKSLDSMDGDKDSETRKKQDVPDQGWAWFTAPSTHSLPPAPLAYPEKSVWRFGDTWCKFGISYVLKEMAEHGQSACDTKLVLVFRANIGFFKGEKSMLKGALQNLHSTLKSTPEQGGQIHPATLNNRPEFCSQGLHEVGRCITQAHAL